MTDNVQGVDIPMELTVQKPGGEPTHMGKVQIHFPPSVVVYLPSHLVFLRGIILQGFAKPGEGGTWARLVSKVSAGSSSCTAVFISLTGEDETYANLQEAEKGRALTINCEMRY